MTMGIKHSEPVSGRTRAFVKGANGAEGCGRGLGGLRVCVCVPQGFHTFLSNILFAVSQLTDRWQFPRPPYVQFYRCSNVWYQ